MDPYLQGNVRLRLQATSTVEEVCAILHHVHVLQPDPASLRLIRAGRIISDRNQTLSAFIDAAAVRDDYLRGQAPSSRPRKSQAQHVSPPRRLRCSCCAAPPSPAHSAHDHRHHERSSHEAPGRVVPGRAAPCCPAVGHSVRFLRCAKSLASWPSSGRPGGQRPSNGAGCNHGSEGKYTANCRVLPCFQWESSAARSRAGHWPQQACNGCQHPGSA